LLVDGREALVSSQNLSKRSLQYNRELGITLTDSTILSQLARTSQMTTPTAAS
jgi:phosphatidylserine/phosphatidylglycerophosphate/cardiolipin synthase-like enzyme